MKTILLSISFLLCSNFLIGQEKDVQESLHVELNDQFFIAGESILVTAFCTSKKTGKLSNLSKLLYLEIKGPNDFSIQRKLSLEGGVGQDEIFLNSSVPTGHYVIHAYTRWQRNFKSYFEQPLTIVNPFEAVSAATNSEKKESTLGSSNDKSDYSFDKRSIHQIPVELPDGKYAVSIKKVNEFVDWDVAAGELINNESKGALKNGFEFLPEVRGELMEGKIVNSKNKALAKTDLTLTVKGLETQLVTAKTNEDGSFIFHFQPSRTKANLYITAPRLNSSYSIALKDEFEKYPIVNLNTNPLELSDIQKNRIVEKSISNQIENAYLEQKKKQNRSTLPIEQLVQFDRNYILDDYTRFPSLPETFIEYIPAVGVQRKKNPVFKISPKHPEALFTGDPLILLDGVPVDSRKLMTYNPLEIKEVHIMTNRFYVGSLASDGILNVATFTGDLPTFKLSDSILQDELLPGSSLPSLFSVSNEKRTSREPDQREQLYWNPNFHTSTNSNVEFTTSDVPGKYQLKIVGITEDGKFIKQTKSISVE